MSTETPGRELPGGWHVERTHGTVGGLPGWTVLNPTGKPAAWGFTSRGAVARRAWEIHLDGQGASGR